MATGEKPRVKFGVGVAVTSTLTNAPKAEPSPVPTPTTLPPSTNVDTPSGAVLLAVIVTTLLALAGLVPNVVVSPAGGSALRVTACVKTPIGTTESVVAMEPPWARSTGAGETARTNAGDSTAKTKVAVSTRV